MNSEEVVVVYQASSEAEAAIVLGRLEANGIDAELLGEDLGSVFGLSGGSLGWVRVVVNVEDQPLAQALLSEEPPLLDDDAIDAMPTEEEQLNELPPALDDDAISSDEE